MTFMVIMSVPVLSLQMHDADPSVSTASRFLTSTLLAANDALCRDGERDGHSGEEALGHVCHDDSDGEHEVLDPFATDSDADAEEDDAHRDGEGAARITSKHARIRSKSQNDKNKA